ncbi:MAG: hypothetical protein AAF242_17295, partial [Bacteroidota bacterium]
MLSNVSTLPMTTIATDVEKIVFNQPFQMPAIQHKLQELINHELYSGQYISDSKKMVLAIIRSKNRLYAKLGNNPPFEIYPKGQHQFFGKKVELEITFEVQDDTIIGLSADRMGQSFHFKKEKS